MKISEFKGERALEFLAEVAEYAETIFQDEQIRDVFSSAKENAQNPRSGREMSYFFVAKLMCSMYKHETMEILTVLNDKAEDLNPIEIIKSVAELLKEVGVELLPVFSSSEQKGDKKSSGAATENSEAEALELSYDILKTNI